MRYKFIVGLIKFYLVFSIFGMFANIITYASADMLYFINNKESYLYAIFTSPETMTDEIAFEAILYFFNTAFDSIPGNIYFEETLGLFIDGANGNIFSFIDNVEDIAKLGKTLKIGFVDYMPYFLRDLSVATLASFVMFIVADLKDKIIGRRSLASFLGFAFSLFFWILAGYTFGNCLVTALELRISEGGRNTLYVVIIIFAVAFEAVVHSYAKKCPLHKLLVLALVKIVFNVIKAFLAWLMCINVTKYYSLQTAPALIFISLLFLVFSAVEMNTSKWAETGVSFIKLK